ncbi:MAG: hypothetical protein K9G83_09740 [Hyphomonadaceae bacterium]|nr:hypothetical protein [Hyphomonadaceae bacterium]
MKILFDQGTPAPLRRFLSGHEIRTAYEMGWQSLQNGDLLERAQTAVFAAIITTDQNLRYQQNLTGRPAIVVLMTTSWPVISPAAERVVAAVARLAVDAYIEIDFA